MVYEALEKTLEYVRVGPRNTKLINHASFQESEGFEKGIDSQEFPEVLQFIARYGHLWLQYAVEDNVRNPTGVIKLLSLESALNYDPYDIPTRHDITTSPLTIIMNNQEKAFEDARKFADDKDITYHHGISMSRKQRGYGTELLNYALDNTPNIRDKVVICHISAAKVEEESNRLVLAANESSYTIHMKAGFVLVGVVDPPVNDDTITYYSFIRRRDSEYFRFNQSRTSKLRFNRANVSATIQQVRELTSSGYLGVSYNKKSHEMTFMKLT